MTKPSTNGGEEWSVGRNADQHLKRAKGAAHNSIKEVQAQYGFKVHLERQTAKSGRASDQLLNSLSPMRVARLSNTPRKMKKKSRIVPIILIILSIVIIIVTAIVMINTG